MHLHVQRPCDMEGPLGVGQAGIPEYQKIGRKGWDPIPPRDIWAKETGVDKTLDDRGHQVCHQKHRQESDQPGNEKHKDGIVRPGVFIFPHPADPISTQYKKGVDRPIARIEPARVRYQHDDC